MTWLIEAVVVITAAALVTALVTAVVVGWIEHIK